MDKIADLSRPLMKIIEKLNNKINGGTANV